jgi:hypothetical protein
MAADAGAQQILDLLNAPSERLYRNALAFSKASRKAPRKPHGVIPQSGAEALTDMRNFCRELRAQIDAIETSQVGSKLSALDALDTIDRQIGEYQHGLEFGASKPAIPKLRRSKRLGKKAASGLRDVIKGLSQ